MTAEDEQAFEALFSRLGLSIDWSLEYATISEHCRRLCQLSFSGELVIVTMRPEPLPACVAVMAHPEDTRFKELVGRTALTPLFCVPVAIIVDEQMRVDKGTGGVMVCTFGDATDMVGTDRVFNCV